MYNITQISVEPLLCLGFYIEPVDPLSHVVTSLPVSIICTMSPHNFITAQVTHGVVCVFDKCMFTQYNSPLSTRLLKANRLIGEAILIALLVPSVNRKCHVCGWGG